METIKLTQEIIKRWLAVKNKENIAFDLKREAEAEAHQIWSEIMKKYDKRSCVLKMNQDSFEVEIVHDPTKPAEELRTPPPIKVVDKQKLRFSVNKFVANYWLSLWLILIIIFWAIILITRK